MKDSSLTTGQGARGRPDAPGSSGRPNAGWWVLTADQVDSRRHEDAVPGAIEALARRCGAAMRLPFERTVGDELQGLTRDAGAIVEAVSVLSYMGEWRIGLGLGPVETPLPAHSRDARGRAFIAARDAIGLARRQATGIALVTASDPEPQHAGRAPMGPPTDADPGQHAASDDDAVHDPAAQADPAREKTVSGSPYRGEQPEEVVQMLSRYSTRADSALIVLRALLARRTQEGWQAVELLDSGLNRREVAARLGISDSAVSQRVTRAQRDEGARAQALARELLDDLQACLETRWLSPQTGAATARGTR